MFLIDDTKTSSLKIGQSFKSGIKESNVKSISIILRLRKLAETTNLRKLISHDTVVRKIDLLEEISSFDSFRMFESKVKPKLYVPKEKNFVQLTLNWYYHCLSNKLLAAFFISSFSKEKKNSGNLCFT